MSGSDLLPKLRRAAGLVDRWHWLILLLAAPLFVFPSPARTPVLLVLPFLWLVAWLAGGPALPGTPLNAALLLFSLMLLVSLWTTFDLVFSLPKIAGALLGLGTYFAIVRLTGGQLAALWRLVALFVLSAGGLAVLGLVGVNWLDKVPALTAISQHLPVLIRGLPGAEVGLSANEVAGAIIIVLPLQAGLLVTTWQRWPRLPAASPLARRPRLWVAAQVVLVLLSGGLLLLTQSRSAWLGFGVGLALIVAGSGRRARWLLLGGGVLAIVALLVLGGPGAVVGLMARIVGSDIDAKSIQRQSIWYYGLLTIRSFPFTGMGLNVFRKALPELYPSVPLPVGFDIAHAHNQLLQAAINFGLPGLVAYLGLWFGAAWALLAAYRATADPWLRRLALGLGAGLAAYFVYGMFDVVDVGAKVGIFFWFALALVIGVYEVAHARPAASVPSPAGVTATAPGGGQL